jgi:hypothetical protein
MRAVVGALARSGLLSVLTLLLVGAGGAAAQIDLRVEPAMTKGAAGAPITIVEFSDYQ